MKVRNISIGIKTPTEALTEFTQVLSAIAAGNPPKKKTEGIYFASVDAMRKVLTPKRLGLLQLIREKCPNSIYELAQASNRDLKNVQDDVALLSRLGLVSLSRPKSARSRVVPRVDYDQLQLQIPMI